MKKAQKGDKVKVHYTGKLSDGTVFDSSRERDPMEFTLGEGMLIPGFEKAVDGMEVGDSTTVNIQPGDAYGERRDDLVMKVPRAEFPENINPDVGVGIMIKHPKAGQIETVITEVTDAHVLLDANHHLAGKELNFEIELVEIA